MERSVLIGGNWGTTNLRVLRRPADRPLDRERDVRIGPGVAELQPEAFEPVLFDLIEDWLEDAPEAEIWLCGMAGSNLGWIEAPYVSAPASVGAIAAAVRTFEARGRRIRIVPGVSCINALGQPDMMRGEETETVGALAMVAAEPKLVCAPGTHFKWIKPAGDGVSDFLTGLSGELYATLRTHSVLARHDSGVFDEAAFWAGVDAVRSAGPERLTHLLFSTRSRQLSGALEADKSGAYLSGLLLAAECLPQVEELSRCDAASPPLVIVGAPDLSGRIRRLFAHFGVRAMRVDGLEATAKGFERISAALSP